MDQPLSSVAQRRCVLAWAVAAIPQRPLHAYRPTKQYRSTTAKNALSRNAPDVPQRRATIPPAVQPRCRHDTRTRLQFYCRSELRRGQACRQPKENSQEPARNASADLPCCNVVGLEMETVDGLPWTNDNGPPPDLFAEIPNDNAPSSQSARAQRRNKANARSYHDKTAPAERLARR